MSLTESLRDFLADDATIAGIVGAAPNSRIHYGHTPQGFNRPFLWYQRRGTEDDELLDDEAGAMPLRVFFDLECVSLVVSEMDALAAAVRQRLANHRGSFGGMTVLGIFVRDQDDDYVPRNVSGDVGLHLAAFDVEIIPKW